MKEVLLIGSLLITPCSICLWEPRITLVFNHAAPLKDFPKTFHQDPLVSQPCEMVLVIMHLGSLLSTRHTGNCGEWLSEAPLSGDFIALFSQSKDSRYRV